MRSKVVAAEMATAAGIPAVICNGLREGALAAALAGEDEGTRFPARGQGHSSFKLWLRYAKPAHGTLVVDAGAARALREGGTSLLPVGIVEVRGAFDAGDAVEIVTAERRRCSARASAATRRRSCGRWPGCSRRRSVRCFRGRPRRPCTAITSFSRDSYRPVVLPITLVRGQMSYSRHMCAAALAAALLLPAAPAAARSSCAKLPAFPTRATTDPVLFQDAAKLTLTSSRRLHGVRVRLIKGKRLLATGRAKRTGAGKAELPLRFRHVLGGRAKLIVTARAAGCRKRGRVVREWLFAPTQLPVIAGRSSAYVEDYGSSMKVVLRTVAGEALKDITAELVAPGGAVIATATHRPSFRRVIVLELPLDGALAPGKYTIRIKGRADGRSGLLRRVQSVALRSADGADSPAGPSPSPAGDSSSGLTTQRATVDWSGGQWQGREVGGFVVPGLGYGEIVCRPNAQWLRFFSSRTGREIAMMNWTRRDWVDYHEDALREAVLTPYTGTQFNEGFNKFGPTPEQRSTGTFEGIISDRGAFGSAGGEGLPPTTLSLAWSWDFSDQGNARCAVSATLATETAGTAAPLARSVSINWRGDENAPKRNGQTTIVEGLGRIDVTCDRYTGGVRYITITGPEAATITKREGSVEEVTSETTGPISYPLVNNGMIRFDFGGGRTLLLSSRFKANDPDGSQNFCFIAGQAIVP